MTELIDQNQELLNDVKLLNSMFTDLNECIKDQSHKIDLIEDNMTKVETEINESINKLEETSNYKKEINKKYLTLAGLGGIILFLCIL